MTWISLVCLLALSSSVYSRSAYGGYGGASVQQIPNFLNAMRDQSIQRQTLPTLQVAPQGYGQQQQANDWSSAIQQQDTSKLLNAYSSMMQKALPAQNYGQFSQGYGAMPRLINFDQQQPQVPQVAPTLPLTPADTLCRGQAPETVIPLEDGRKFVVCLDDSKGVEQQCPKSLFYHPTSRRCERKLGPLQDMCASQPCLNGGQCIPTDSSYQCQCAPNFDGQTCELDARICQTQQPCGQSPDVKCQSFRLGAALQYICIIQDGAAYGLNAQQVLPSPCQNVDGPQSLTVTDKGFIMCDGERMFVESCPGGTIWDDANKACVWPDMQASAPQPDESRALGYGQSSYGSSRQMIAQPTYGNQIRMHHHHEHPKHTQSHWSAQQPKLIQAPVQSYGQQLEQPQFTQSYGSIQQLQQPKSIQAPVQSYGSVQQLDQPRLIQSFGSIQQQEQPKFNQAPVSSYSSIQQFQQPKSIQAPVQSYGSVQQLEQPKFIQAPIQSSYGSALTGQQLEQPKLAQSSGY